MNDDVDATAGEGTADGGRRDREEQPWDEDGGVGVYEAGEGTVLYDTENPLAWIQSTLTLETSEMV